MSPLSSERVDHVIELEEPEVIALLGSRTQAFGKAVTREQRVLETSLSAVRWRPPKRFGVRL